MKNRFMKTLGLIILLIIVVLLVVGLIYFDMKGKLPFAPDKQTNTNQNTNNAENTANNQDSAPPDDQEQQTITFVPYQSPDGLFQLQLPDFWTGEERNGAILFYSYNPAEGEPAQNMKIEIARQDNEELLTATEWLEDQDIDPTAAQAAVLSPAQGLMIINDNTEANPNDISSTIYMPVNDQMFVISADSDGDIRDVAVQFFNAILNSWQWAEDVEPVITAESEVSGEADVNTNADTNTEDLNTVQPTDSQENTNTNPLEVTP